MGYADVRGANEDNYVKFNLMSNNKNITWNDINWVQTQTNVRKIQHRIYKARINGDIGRVHWLQKFLINNIGAKLIAVRQVTTLNKGPQTTGIDSQIITTPEKKCSWLEN